MYIKILYELHVHQQELVKYKLRFQILNSSSLPKRRMRYDYVLRENAHDILKGIFTKQHTEGHPEIYICVENERLAKYASAHRGSGIMADFLFCVSFIFTSRMGRIDMEVSFSDWTEVCKNEKSLSSVL